MMEKDNLSFEFAERLHNGEPVLFWIEQFGLHFLEDNQYGYKGSPNSDDHFLILRIISDKNEDTMHAYYCFFNTNNDGITTFCIKKHSQNTTKKLRVLFENAKWRDPRTMNWWKTLFLNGLQNIDDVLCRPEILVSDSCDLKMLDFLQQINEVITYSIQKLDLGITKITKICIVEQYAMALPLKYAFYKMFPNSYIYTYVFTDKNPMRNYNWTGAHPFYIPKELLNRQLNTSPVLTIGDVFQIGEKGITITMPLTKAELGSPIISGCDLNWGDLLLDGIQYDYQIGEIRFKRFQLSMIADGFQTIYIKCDSNIVACSIYENGKYKIKSLHSNVSEEAQKLSISEPQLGKKNKGIKTEEENTQSKPSLDKESQASVTSTSDAMIIHVQNTIPTEHLDEGNNKNVLVTSMDTKNLQRSKNAKEKCLAIKLALGEALDRTTDFLKVIARSYLQSIDPKQNWEFLYGEALKKEDYQYNTWIEHKEVEFSNFFQFLVKYQWKIKSKGTKAKWWKSYSDIESAVKYLIVVRNFRVHKKDNVVGIGEDNIYDAFREMIKIASKLNNYELKNEIEKYKAIFKESYDSSITSLCQTDDTLQEIFKEFETAKTKYN